MVSAWVLAQRADYRIIPLPKSVQTDTTQVFTLRSGMGIAYDSQNPQVAQNATFLQQWVMEATGVELALTPSDAKAAVRLILGTQTDKKSKKNKKKQQPQQLTPQQQESYTLTVGSSGIEIRGPQPEGIFRGVQTLRKSLPVKQLSSVELPFVQIADQPRFTYRGVLLDCGRHFFTVDFIKQFLDVMALHGCNQFHWHLTEDQGWRFEVMALPDLAVKGSVREKTVIGPGNNRIYDNVPYGGYYTQDECREVVRYAAERYINVVPEIDMPGHMVAAVTAYPELSCDPSKTYSVRIPGGISKDVLNIGKDETIDFLKCVLGHVAEVFPYDYIHIGGDECPTDQWKNNADCKRRIEEEGLGDVNGLQPWLVQVIGSFLKDNYGKKVMAWDEVIDH